jgi:hypothetical protein
MIHIINAAVEPAPMPDNRHQDRHLMQIDPEAPGFLELLRGEGDLGMRILAWAGVFVLLPLLIAGTITCWSAVL